MGNRGEWNGWQSTDPVPDMMGAVKYKVWRVAEDGLIEKGTFLREEKERPYCIAVTVRSPNMTNDGIDARRLRTMRMPPTLAPGGVPGVL